MKLQVFKWFSDALPCRISILQSSHLKFIQNHAQNKNAFVTSIILEND